VPAGTFLAILGTSGSGKTTFLNTISGRSEDYIVGGEIFFNGHEVSKEEIKKTVGYVLQSDQLLPTLTVRETLQYAGLLRLPEHFTKERKLEIVEEIIGELALRECSNRLVGGFGKKRGISGGEMRRVSIGVQMLSNPGVIYLDEPTSGLDSFSAANLVQTLLSLSRSNNKSVIMTIHQPKNDIFKLFDRILLLSKGNIVYYGPTKDIVGHFASLGYDCPYDSNPADYILDLITVNLQNEKIQEESNNRLKYLIEGYRNSKIKQQIQSIDNNSDENNSNINSLDNDKLSIDNKGTDKKEKKEKKEFKIENRNTSLLLQTYLLTKRSLLHIARDKTLLAARMIETVLMALICGGIFYQLGVDLVGINSRVSCFYVITILQPYLIIIATILQYSEELLVFDREHYDQMYSSYSYWFATKISNLPFEVLSSLIFSCIFYWMADLRPAATNFFWFFLTLTLVQYASASIGMMSTSFIRQFAGASLMANLFMTFWSISAGFLLNPSTFPFYINWISYTSIYQYSFGAMAANELIGNQYPCPFEENDIQCLLYNGDQILSRLTLKSNNVRNNCLILFTIIVCLNLISFLALRFIKHKPK
ncbi:hypothetical protein DICPUDRAFT_27275, partial [Dictyostelium purpureum]